MDNKPQPSKLKYILAWMLSCIIIVFLKIMSGTILPLAFFRDYLVNYLTYFEPLVEGALIYIIIIIIYKKLFTSLNLLKVMPYFYILGTLSVFLGLGTNAKTMSTLGMEILYTNAFMTICVWVFVVLMIKAIAENNYTSIKNFNHTNLKERIDPNFSKNTKDNETKN